MSGLRFGLSLSMQGRGGKAWTPDKLGSKLLAQWTDDRQDLITYSSGKISSWKDVIGAYDLAQATDASRPVEGAYPAVFDGTASHLTLAASPFPIGASPCEIWALVDQGEPPSDVTPDRRAFSYGGTSNNNTRQVSRVVVSGINRARAIVGQGASAVVVTDTHADFSGLNVVRAMFAADSVSIQVNDNDIVSAAAVPNTATGRTRMGANTSNTAAAFWSGGITDILITNPLSEAEAAKLRDYLMAKRARYEGAIFASIDAASQTAQWVWKYDRERMIRVKLAPVTFNGLPTVSEVDFAPLGDPASASWVAAQSSGGDWFPPIIVSADTGGDGSTSNFFTGGNHGSDGGATGDPTALLAEWSTARLDEEGHTIATDGAGWCEEATVIWTNKVMAYNTVTLSRHVLDQRFEARLFKGGLEFTSEITALEDIRIKRLYGVQMVTTAYQDELHFWGGANGGPQTDWAATAQDSGARRSYPTEAIMTVKGEYGYQAIWLDRSFGLGDTASVEATRSLMLTGAVTGKGYIRVVDDDQFDTDNLAIPEGGSVSYRGGASWFPDDGNGGIEAFFKRKVDGLPEYAAIFTEAGSGIIHADADDVGKTATVTGSLDDGEEIISSGGLPVSRSGYGAVYARL